MTVMLYTSGSVGRGFIRVRCAAPDCIDREDSFDNPDLRGVGSLIIDIDTAKLPVEQRPLDHRECRECMSERYRARREAAARAQQTKLARGTNFQAFVWVGIRLPDWLAHYKHCKVHKGVDDCTSHPAIARACAKNSGAKQSVFVKDGFVYDHRRVRVLLTNKLMPTWSKPVTWKELKKLARELFLPIRQTRLSDYVLVPEDSRQTEVAS